MLVCIECNAIKASSGKCSHSAWLTVCVFLLCVSILEKENIFPSWERSEGEGKKLFCIGNDDSLKEFLKEAKFMISLQHDNVVQLKAICLRPSAIISRPSVREKGPRSSQEGTVRRLRILLLILTSQIAARINYVVSSDCGAGWRMM